MTTQQTAKTLYLEVNGIRYAYRRPGQALGIPLLFLHHFRATMDHWDPAVVDGLALTRPIILFDNAGVGHSSGSVPDTVLAMANHVVYFLSALRLRQVDIFGFSLGGYVAELIALNHPNYVRRVILAGTGPSVGPDILPLTPEVGAIATRTFGEEEFLQLFFSPSDPSRRAGKAFWSRVNERKGTSEEPRADYVSGKAMMAQVAALTRWGTLNPKEADRLETSFDRLEEINAPVLVVNGHTDIMVPTVGSYIMSQRIPNAHLLIYPDSGHGAIFQYSELFVQHATIFLDA